MTLPFYYSFKEFTAHYKADLSIWLKENSGKNETDYLKWIYSLAGYYLGYQWFNVDSPKYSVTDMSFGAEGITTEYDISNYVSIFIGVVEGNLIKKFNLFNDNKLAEFLYDFDGDLRDFIRHERFWFDGAAYLLIPFFDIEKEKVGRRTVYDENNEPLIYEGETIHEDGEFKMGTLYFDYDGYEIFLEEIKLIIEFILEKLDAETEKPETKSNLTIPEKIVLLEQLGVFVKLTKDGVRPENEYKIIQRLIGGDYNNVKKYCLNRKTKNKSFKGYQITDKHRNAIKNFYNSKTY
ncbi:MULTISPECIES: hypothetical protein [Chryseobacterium]|uniref:Uncharacterized protein n=1 Tax=Chryseobacterium geocarposphaerae TaxID=1416776 RepID=A0ABU1LGP0_9FLAO|nr:MULTISPECIES: hypothetical protein [Chryseobacterium]MDR6405881.1 hypothetical protein [Chryseobacterium geocarposphaerae]MDR6698955.1 hypothetical protein [Chryseobacterium ginsenosidimutans]